MDGLCNDFYFIMLYEEVVSYADNKMRAKRAKYFTHKLPLCLMKFDQFCGLISLFQINYGGGSTVKGLLYSCEYGLVATI